jgi:hypothetical protein
MTSLATTRLEKANLTLDCAPGYAADPDLQLQCVPERKACAANEYQDADGACKGHPAMSVSGSSTTLLIHVRKTNRTKTNYGLAEVRLTSGDVEQSEPVQWTAVIPNEDAAWLSLQLLNGSASKLPARGEVYASSPFSLFQVSVDASGLNDTKGAALYSSSISITSHSANGAVLFAQGSDQLNLTVRVAVVATAYLSEADVTILSKTGREPVSLSGVSVGMSLVIAIQTRDCDRLVIDRPDQQLKLVVSSTLGAYKPRNIALLYRECTRCAGLFEVELPGTALDNPGVYQLISALKTHLSPAR